MTVVLEERIGVRAIDPNWRKAACPLCGLQIYIDDLALTLYHEAPECKRFQEHCRNFDEADLLKIFKV